MSLNELVMLRREVTSEKDGRLFCPTLNPAQRDYMPNVFALLHLQQVESEFRKGYRAAIKLPADAQETALNSARITLQSEYRRANASISQEQASESCAALETFLRLDAQNKAHSALGR